MKRVQKLLCLCLALTLGVSVLTACGGGAATPAAAGASGTASGSGAAVAGADGISRIIVLGQDTDMTSFDPHKHNDVQSGTGTRMIYDTLIRLTPENTFEGQLAESWEYMDATTVTFKLKEGVKFHNGETLTAEDVKFSLDRQKKSGFVGHLVAMIEEVIVVDDLNFNLKVSEDSAALVSSLSHMGSAILCKSQVEALEMAGKTIDDEPVGTGPYTFGSWTVGSEFEMLRFADYFDPAFAAKNEGLLVKVIKEANSRTIALENGEIDFLAQVPSVSVDSIAANPDLKLIEYESTHLQFIAFNCSKPPFDNKALREAVSYCVNRDDIIQVQMSGKAQPNYTPLGVAAIGYTPDVTKREFDLVLAKQKLDEAGFSDGFTFTLSTIGEERARAAAVIQAACAKVGITMNIEVLENSAYFNKMGLGEHEAGMSFWAANAEPDNSYNPLFNSKTIKTGGSNYACFNSPEIDELLWKGQTTLEQKERLESYYGIAKKITEEAAWCPVFSETGYLASRANVDGVVVYPISTHLFQGLQVVE